MSEYRPRPKKAVKKRSVKLAAEADPRRYNPKTGYYGYPLQDYRTLGATNLITQGLARKRRYGRKG